MEGKYTKLQWFATLLVLGSFFYSAHPVAAAITVATGTVTDQDNAALVGVQIDCLSGENNQGGSAVATSNASGHYSCDLAVSSLANGSSVSIQPRSFTGYRSAQTQNFTWTGVTQTINFQYQIAPKTINVSVFYEDGQLVGDVQVTAQPINLQPGEMASQVQEDFSTGNGDLTTTGGQWIVKADANFSETNADRYPWISITTPIQVEFADDNSVESTNIEFVVAKSVQKVQVTLLDASGATLNSGGVGDAYFEGYSGTYGSISTSRKVNPTTGISELYLLPGVWKVSALDQQLNNQSFDPDEATFVVSDEPGTHNIGTIQASANTAQLSGTVNVGGIAKTNVQVVAANVDTGTRMTATTDPNGNYSIANAPFGTYAITVNDNSYIPTQTASTTLTATDPSATGLTVEAETADTTVRGSVVDGNGAPIVNVPGTMVVKGEGVEFTAPVQPDGTYELKMYTSGLPDTDVQLEFVPQPGADVFAPAPVTVPVVPNSTFQSNMTMSSDEATISGNITDFDGQQLGTALGNKPKMMAMNPDTGAVETANIAADGSYALMVGPGDWTLLPQLNDSEATVLPSNTSSIAVNVVAGETTTADVPMFEKSGTAEVTVTDPNGIAVKEAPVLFTNLPALQTEAQATGNPIDQNRIIQIAATTNSSGVATTGLPNGDFTAYFGTNPDVNAYTNPAAQEFTVSNGDTTTLDGSYKEAGSTVAGNIGADFTSASITFYSTEGGTETFAVDPAGEYSGALDQGEWKAIASGVKDGQVHVAEHTVNVAAGTTDFNPTLENTGLNFPSAATVTGSATEPMIVGNTDGASVSIPAYAAGFSGNIIATIQPVISFGNTSNISQVGLSYEVTVTDDLGTPVKTLNSPATVTLPLPSEFTQNIDTTEMTGAYYQPDLQTFLNDGVVASAKGSKMMLQTKHLSRFAVTTAEVEAVVVSTPTNLKVKKIHKHSVVVDWNSSTGATRYVLQVRKKGVKNTAKWKKFSQITKTKRKVTSLKSGTNYQTRVKACNASMCSDYTTWKKFKTKN